MIGWRIAGQSISKRDAGPASNQDRWQIAGACPIRIAVADGATQGFRSGLWAELLVARFIAGSLAPGRPTQVLLAEIERLAIAWRQATPLAPDAPWHQEARALRGGAATFVGLELRPKGRRWLWSALAVGDANVFVVAKGGRLRRSFPLRLGSFDPAPALVSTRKVRNEALVGTTLRARGTYRRGDTFILATDALAWWILDASEMSPVDTRRLWRAVRSERSFATFVDELRRGGVPDDDMTLVLARRS